MTPEERYEQIQRQLEFLAAIQAQNAARMAENSKQIAENSLQITENSRQISDNSRQISQLADSLLRIGRVVETGFKLTNEHLSILADSQINTYERLNTLINILERYFSNGRN